MPALAPKIKFKPLVRKPTKKDKPFFTPKAKRKSGMKLAKKNVIDEKKGPAAKKAVSKKYVITAKTRKLVALKGKIDQASTKNRQHESSSKKVDETKKAVHVSPALDKSSQAQSKQVDEMANQKPKKFDAIKFASDILTNIRRVIPASEQEMENDGTSSTKMAIAQQTMSNSLEEEKTKSGGELGGAVTASPDVSSIPTKEIKPLRPEIAETSSSIKGAAISPDLKKPSETSLAKESSQIDDKMRVSGVTESQIAKSNEPSFQSAALEKNKSQDKAKCTHQEYLLQAKPISNQVAKQTAQETTSSVAQSALKKRAGFSQVERKKAEQKAKEEVVRTKIAQDLDKIYNKAKSSVEERLANLNTQVNTMFDDALKSANTTFENNVRRRTETSFLDDLISWATGIPREVENVFKEEQEIFINTLKPKVFEIGTLVEQELNLAMKEIELGKLEVAKYWASLSKDEQKIGSDLYESVNGRFSELETSVEDASENLKESITTKFNEAIASLEETFNKIKEENKSWLERAYDAVVGVIAAIIEMKNLLLNILSKAANAIEAIIKDPIGFLTNLLRAIKLGFTRFGANILVHLKEGFIAWLMGNMPPSIQFPQTWDLKGIFTFVMSVLGLTWQNIRSRAERMFGATVVSALETGFEIFMIVKNEGLGGLWKYIQDQVGNLKTMVLDAIQNMLIEKVVKAGITWVISLFNPAGAFIKACKLIYDVVSWFINNARRLLDLVNSIVDSVALIVAGQIDSAVNFVENSLKKAIPIVIGFLAGLLGIGDLSAKIQAILDKIQAPINKAIDWVLKKAGDFVKKIAKAVASGARKLMSWLGLKKQFQAADNKNHTVNIEGSEGQPKIIIRSEPKTLDVLIEEFKLTSEYKDNPGKYNSKIDRAISLRNTFENAMKTNQKEGVDYQGQFDTMSTTLIDYIKDMFVGSENSERKVSFGGLHNGVGEGMTAEVLVSGKDKGQKTSDPKGIFKDLFKRKHKGGRVPYYIQGHLLNYKLDGDIREQNLVPLSRNANGEHERIIEKSLKDFYDDKKKLKYVVTPVFGLSNQDIQSNAEDNAQEKSKVETINKIKDFERKAVPIKLNIKASYYVKEGPKEVEKPIYNGTIQNNIEVSEDSYEL